MTSTSDITIIGGGIIGLLTARELLLAGASVTIIDKHQLGQESSWAGGGILLPLYPWRQKAAITSLVTHSLKLYPELAMQLRNATGIDPEWYPCGLLITKTPDVTSASAWCKTNSIQFYQAEQHFFKNLHTNPVNPLWLPEIAQARNPRLVKSLKQDIINKGAVIREECEATALTRIGNRITAIKTSSGVLATNHIVLSAGAWTSRLYRQFFPEINASIPKIEPVKGQMILFEARPETLPYMVLDDDQYLIPRRDGKILAGSTVERDNFNKTTSEEAMERLTAFALTLMPSLKNFPIIRHWAGLRPGTESGIPYIDLHPDIINLSINAGHFRNGLAMAPASAKLMADLILDRSTTIQPEPYKLSSSH